MKTLEWTTIDKSAWGPGPWDDEPDKMQWLDEATGFAALIHRGPRGSLCGYVGVPSTHPWHGLDYSAHTAQCTEAEETSWCHCPTIDGTLEVHGGITFADRCQTRADPSSGVCHVVEPGEPEDVWWFGFDCAHYQDLMPAYHSSYGFTRMEDDVYRDVEYVRGQVAGLAAQLAEVGSA